MAKRLTMKEAKLRILKTEILCSAFRSQDDEEPVSYMLVELQRLVAKGNKKLIWSIV